MGNPISHQLTLGTIAELLVQASLLQFDVQAAPPLKDSGNDLIAIRGAAIRSIQVKATQSSKFRAPKSSLRYDVVAAVRMRGDGRKIFFDACDIFLIEKELVAGIPRAFHEIPKKYRLGESRIDELFPKKKAEPDARANAARCHASC